MPARSTLVVTLLTSLAAPLGAQQIFQIYPERNGSAATYVSRAAGGSNQVELLAEVPGDLIAGVGDVTGAGAPAGTCLVTGYWAWFVDENPSTPETIDVVFHDLDPTTGGPGVEIARVGPFQSPTLTTTTRASVLFTVTFATPVQVPCQGTWFHGVDLAASPWPTTDGLGLYVADHNPPTTRIVGDNPRLGAPTIAWQIVSGVASQVPTPLTMRMGPTLAAPLLTVGGIDPANVRQSPAGSPNYGAGGLFPDVVGRSDGVTLLIESANHAGGFAYGFVSLGISPAAGIPVFGFAGELWLNPLVLIPLGSVQLPGGSGSLNVFSPGSISPSAAGVRLSYQAVVAGGPAGVPTFTNASSTSF